MLTVRCWPDFVHRANCRPLTAFHCTTQLDIQPLHIISWQFCCEVVKRTSMKTSLLPEKQEGYGFSTIRFVHAPTVIDLRISKAGYFHVDSPTTGAMNYFNLPDTNVVLILDDQLTSRAILSQVVRGISSNLTLQEETSPSSALVWANTHTADLVLADYQMPGMNGIEFIRRLRQLPGYQHVPVIMI